VKSESTFFIGIDLGRTRNYTAMAVLERTWHAATAEQFIRSSGLGYTGEYRFRVVGLDRVSLGTPYPQIVDWVKGRVREYKVSDIAAVIVDATGVGSAVMDYLKRASLGARLIGTVVTGNQATPVGVAGLTPAGYYTVSRTELLTGLQIAVQTRRLTITMTECHEWEALRRELVLLRMEGKRAGVQDDLAFALALTVWWGMRNR
jgi:hypothetical protein